MTLNHPSDVRNFYEINQPAIGDPATVTMETIIFLNMPIPPTAPQNNSRGSSVFSSLLNCVKCNSSSAELRAAAASACCAGTQALVLFGVNGEYIDTIMVVLWQNAWENGRLMMVTTKRNKH